VEAELMTSWLWQVAQGQEHVSPADEDMPQLSFLEPNLGLSLIARESDHVTIRMFFAHESGIPDAIPAKSTTDAIVDLVVARDDVARAADEWAAALGNFPERTPRNWPSAAEREQP
jgi:CubicO group peptidase (beta-lactamase class C family)